MRIFDILQPRKKDLVVCPTICGGCGLAIYFNQAYQNKGVPNSGWFHQDTKLVSCENRRTRALPYVEVTPR